MHTKIITGYLIVFILSTLQAYAQQKYDKIYFTSGANATGIIIEARPDVVIYKLAENIEGPDYERKMTDVAIMFKRNGDFMLPAGSWVSVKKEGAKIVKKNKEIVYASFIKNSKGNLIKYLEKDTKKERFVRENEIICIIYEDGSHELKATPQETAKVLNIVSTQLAGGALTPISENQSLSEAGDAKKNIGDAEIFILDDIEKEKFEKRAVLKTNDLSQYLGIITDRSREIEERQDAVDYGCNLFVDEERSVQVSTIGVKEKKNYKIRAYLNQLRLLPYDKVNITWREVSLISELRKGADGRYTGVITVQQLFQGIMDGQPIYQDVTDKRIEIVVAKLDVRDGGETKTDWDVYLGNIGVSQTKER